MHFWYKKKKKSKFHLQITQPPGKHASVMYSNAAKSKTANGVLSPWSMWQLCLTERHTLCQSCNAALKVWKERNTLKTQVYQNVLQPDLRAACVCGFSWMSVHLCGCEFKRRVCHRTTAYTYVHTLVRCQFGCCWLTRTWLRMAKPTGSSRVWKITNQVEGFRNAWGAPLYSITMIHLHKTAKACDNRFS